MQQLRPVQVGLACFTLGEYGALANLNNDRAKAEALFEKAMRKKPRECWHWVGVGASYLGVRPQ